MKVNFIKTFKHQNSSLFACLFGKQSKRGFSLLEVIIATLVVTIGIVGALSLINYSISSATIGKSQIIASGLAQEGLEIVRSIRDDNWHQDITWNTGLGAGEYRVQYNNGALLLLAGNPYLKINSNGYYQYDSGDDTRFSRKIIISTISAIQIKVVSEVTWSERGDIHNVSAEYRLYNWK